MTEPNEIESAAVVDAEATRGKGRPTIAEITAREQAIADREKSIDEKFAELAAAQANLQHLMEQMHGAGRSEPVRASTARTDTVTESVRVGRRYKGGEMPNKFHIPEGDIPSGTSYQWNNHTVFGQENASYSAYMQMQGWVPVPASRHPHLMPVGHEGPIIVDGQILMERPQELTNEALQEDLDRARGEVRAKEAQLYGPRPEGEFQRARANGTNEFNQINRTVERGVPVEPKYQYGDANGLPIE